MLLKRLFAVFLITLSMACFAVTAVAEDQGCETADDCEEGQHCMDGECMS